MLAADKLGVPAGSLSFFLKKRLNFLARKNLMSFHQVREFYNPKSKAYALDLKDTAASSVFNAWWGARLDDEATPELMSELCYMREEIPELDEDLHKAFEDKKLDVEKRWEEKRLKKEAEARGETYGEQVTTVYGGGVAVAAESDWNKPRTSAVAAQSGWDQPASSAAVTSVGNWDTPAMTDDNTEATGFDYETENMGSADGKAFGENDHFTLGNDVVGGGDWADEVNDEVHVPQPSFQQQPPSIQW